MNNMMQDMMDKFDQLYIGFMGMPTQYQVIASVGGLVLLGALKNVWRMLYPIRLAVAGLLSSIAYVIRPRKRQTNSVAQSTTDIIAWDLSNKKKTKKTYEFYSTKAMVQKLTDEQIDMLDAAVYKFDIKGNGRLGRERDRRDAEDALPVVEEGIPRKKDVPPFDFSTKENTQAAYDHYSHYNIVHSLTDEQIQIMHEAVMLYEVPVNGGLTRERDRRYVLKEQAKLQEATPIKTKLSEAEVL